MKVDSLSEDGKHCSICQDPMGIANAEGVKEAPIKLVICCGQVIGERCMRMWLQEFCFPDIQRDSCPVCRFVFPGKFLDKLFGREDENWSNTAEGNKDQKEIINLVSPSLSPRQTSRENINAAPLVRPGEMYPSQSRALSAREDAFMTEG